MVFALAISLSRPATTACALSTSACSASTLAAVFVAVLVVLSRAVLAFVATFSAVVTSACALSIAL